MHSYEHLLECFRRESGLYVLGAGASAGEWMPPLGNDFWHAAPIDFLRNWSSLSAEKPLHSALTTSIIVNSGNLQLSKVFPNRVIRQGSLDFPFREILERIPDYYSQLVLKHQIAKPNFKSRITDSYRVFEIFRPSQIANYNHDGLASRFCEHRHRVLEMHGSIDRRFGSPKIRELLDLAREYHLPEIHDGLLMGVPKSWTDQVLALKLLQIGRPTPSFIAIIGYSFAKNALGHDDRVSLDYFLHRFSGFTGKVYVLDPNPDYLCEMLSERLKSNNVIGLSARWNVLAHAMVLTSLAHGERRPINYIYQQLLDKTGGNTAFCSRTAGLQPATTLVHHNR